MSENEERERERRRQKEKDIKETENGRKERRMMKEDFHLLQLRFGRRECVCVCARVRERESKEAMRKISFERCDGGC